MELTTILENIGLSDKEAKIYLALLKFNESLPSVVAKKAGVKRPTAYVILQQLEQKAIVTRVKKGGFLYYRAIDPHVLLNDQETKFAELKSALPELMGLNNKLFATPQMSVFEGKEGLIRIMEDTLTAKTELLCWANVDQAVESLKDYYPKYIEKKVKNKLWLRGVFCYSEMAVKFKKLGEKELREIYLIPGEKFPFKNEINIYNDIMAIISQKDEIGVIIQNQAIADTQRAIFQLGFEYAKILEAKNYPDLNK
jgi:sugar-specific transcriptional regulator TrmB